MPFDGFTTAAVTAEINSRLAGARVERVNAPTADEIVLNLRTDDRQTLKLCLSASSNIPKVNITSVSKDNPMQASALCMHLRKHLNSARLVRAEQPGSERVIRIEFLTTDELGYPRTEYVYAEIMGKYSNVIVTDDGGRIINCVKLVDVTTSSKRQVMPGMSYEAPPPQDKLDPMGARYDEPVDLPDGTRRKMDAFELEADFMNGLFRNAELREEDWQEIIATIRSGNVPTQAMVDAVHGKSETPLGVVDPKKLRNKFYTTINKIERRVNKKSNIKLHLLLLFYKGS